jgi:hypothetical protein
VCVLVCISVVVVEDVCVRVCRSMGFVGLVQVD